MTWRRRAVTPLRSESVLMEGFRRVDPLTWETVGAAVAPGEAGEAGEAGLLA